MVEQRHRLRPLEPLVIAYSMAYIIAYIVAYCNKVRQGVPINLQTFSPK